MSLDPDSLSLDRAAIEQHEWARILALSLDALVRSSRSSTEVTLGPLAERLCSHWLERQDTWMEVTAAGVSVGDEHFLEERQWVLAAFMAGVRRFRPSPHMDDMDGLRLAVEFAALRPTAASVEAFRDWVWADGAEGFEVEIRAGFAEVLDTVLAEHKLEQRTRIMRDSPGFSFAEDAARIASKELDAAAIREEFEVPLTSYSQTLQRSHADQISDANLELARQRFEDPSGWAAAEFEAAMIVPALRGAIPPRRLARQLLTRVSRATNIRLLRYVANLMASEDEFASRVTLHLEALGLGRALARGTEIDHRETRDTLIRFMQLATKDTASSIATGLLRRASVDGSEAVYVADIIHRHDAAKFLDLVDTSNLDDVASKVLLDTLVADDVPPGLLRRALLAIPASCAAAWLDQQSDELFWSLEGAVRKLLQSDSRRVVDRMVEVLGSRHEKRTAKILAEVLDSSGSERWSRRAIGTATRLMAGAGLGERYLLRWATSQSTALHLRVAAVRTSADDPTLLPRLVKRRLTELVDPPEIKAAIKEARRRAKETSGVSARPATDLGRQGDPEEEQTTKEFTER